jgi:long-chain acyl-CoA synthetase
MMVRNSLGDLQDFKPTVMVAVPAIWESVEKGVVQKVNGGSLLVKSIFWGAFYVKLFLVSKSWAAPTIKSVDKTVFSKVKEATGGRIRLCLTGGGPIAEETQVFISLVIATMIGGYGLTETTG